MSHIEPSKVESWLGYLAPDGHYTRLKVITGIKACLGDAGRDIAYQWSELPEHEFISLWNSAGKTTEFGENYLFSQAKKAGYTGRSTHNKGGQEKKVLTNVLPFQPAERLPLAAIRAAWDRCEPFTSHPYITSKKVEHLIPDDIRLEKYKGFSNLVIPVRCTETTLLISYQRIYKDHKTGKFVKRFPKDMPFGGGWYLFGNWFDLPKVIFLFEGWINALVAFHTMQECILSACTFSSATIKSCLKAIKATYPEAKIIVFCDGDNAGKKVYEQCGEFNNVWPYTSPNYTENKKDSWDLWNDNRESFKNELKGIVEFIKKDPGVVVATPAIQSN